MMKDIDEVYMKENFIELTGKLNAYSKMLQNRKKVCGDIYEMIDYRKNCIKNNNYSKEYNVGKMKEILLLESIVEMIKEM